MSLLLNASPWNSTETPKKRIPTIKKTFKPSMLEEEQEQEEDKNSLINKPSFQSFDIFSETNNKLGTGGSKYEIQETSFKENQIKNKNDMDINKQSDNNNNIQENKTNKINQLLENMTGLNIQNDGDSLYNYTSPTNPAIIQNFPSVPIFQRNNAEIIGQGVVGDTNRGRGGGTSSNFVYNTSGNLANLENYSKAYEMPKEVRPYYTQKMGIGNDNDSFEEKILDKIQYLTHLMEEIQSEKTSNITEEFILYTMLGVFVIYVVDAFSKSGKYIR